MRGSVAFLSFILGCAVAAGVPTAAAGWQQKEENVFVGHGKIARRSLPDTAKHDTGKVESTSDSSTGRDPSAEAAAAATTGHTINEIEELERACLGEVNHQRVARGLAPMESDRDLLGVARAYSRRMVEEGFFSHLDPQGRDIRQRLEKARIGWQMVGENLSYSSGYINPIAVSVRGWMDSPGHRRNILEARYNDSAIGVWIAADGTVYFTEIFLRK
jgi:uncharacterized protein YkwD